MAGAGAPVQDMRPVSQVPDTAAGRISQRQDRNATARQAGVKPLARIDTRVANRVQSRLRNRIDPNYDPQANAASPFNVAEEQARSVGRSR